MAIGTKGLMPADLDAMDDSRLAQELEKAKAELFNLRFSAATGQLEDHGRLKAVKRDISRIYTIVRERELGIRTAPSTEE
ncbi:50S ribosomal protein L29 [Bogoriella caseilytica]|uniref:Large ribosomal subunit protein uL29 n=1 Tax=Bogoriella caseilytica TaxID=56055 RepID=A0A3N2BE58_9MICO|nr:50S ribosomal protein L29 [Bogoriella caseilytica]ROR73532.1 large subunit ribosomal protein L29 [Bogoriella caseilytica]